jgi:hypothetical protein
LDALGQDAALAVVQGEMGFQTMADVPPERRAVVACELVERARTVQRNDAEAGS